MFTMPYHLRLLFAAFGSETCSFARRGGCSRTHCRGVVPRLEQPLFLELGGGGTSNALCRAYCTVCFAPNFEFAFGTHAPCVTGLSEGVEVMYSPHLSPEEIPLSLVPTWLRSGCFCKQPWYARLLVLRWCRHLRMDWHA